MFYNGFMLSFLAKITGLSRPKTYTEPPPVTVAYGYPTHSGANVTAKNIYEIPAVFACVELIAKQIATFPKAIYKETSGKGGERDNKNFLHKILCRRPNEYQTSIEFFSQMIGWGITFGRFVIKVKYDKAGRPAALYALDPRNVRLEERENDGRKYYVRFYQDGIEKEEILLPGEIIEWESFGFTFTRDPVYQHARETLGMALSLTNYAASHFRNSAMPKGVLEQPYVQGMPPLSAESRQAVVNAWQNFTGSANAGKTALLEYGLKFSPVQQSIADSRVNETEREVTLKICSIFGVPPTLIGVVEKASYSNVEEFNRQFYQTTISPLLSLIETNIRERLFPPDMVENYYFKFNADSLLRANTNDRYAAHRTGIETGFLTRNEAREKENLPPIAGLDRPIVPLNMKELEKNQQAV